MQKRGIATRVAGVLSVALAFGVAVASASAQQAPLPGGPSPVPCTSAGGGKYDCSFYPAGNGISGGAPVQGAKGGVVGYLNHGTNWVTCQAQGATVHSGAYYNDWWAYTEANDGHWGWVNAVYASGGDNNGPFGSVPGCSSAHGSPPLNTTTTPPPPTSHPHRSSCSATHENQTVSVRFRFYERRYRTYGGEPEGQPPKTYNVQKPSYHRFGSVTIGAATCHSPTGWRVLSPAQVRTGSVGFYVGPGHHVHLSGRGSVTGWGIAAEHVHNGVMDVHGIACKKGHLWSDVRKITSFPLPPPIEYGVSLAEWAANTFDLLPHDKVKCGDLGIDRLHIDADRHGRLRVTAPNRHMGSIIESANQSAGGEVQHLVHTRFAQPPIITRSR